MSLDNKCDTPRVTVVKKTLAYFNKHPMQAATIIGALSLAFVIAATAASYAMALQAKHGCLTFFSKNYNTD